LDLEISSRDNFKRLLIKKEGKMKTQFQGQISSVVRRVSGNEIDNVYEVKIKTNQPPIDLMNEKFNWVKVTIETVQESMFEKNS